MTASFSARLDTGRADGRASRSHDYNLPHIGLGLKFDRPDRQQFHDHARAQRSPGIAHGEVLKEFGL
jgi:hypothetical protein